MKRRSLAIMLVILTGASLVFTWTTSAHNIDLKKAREVARDYARSVRDESGGKYAHYSTNCVRAFPNHNHYVRCSIDYQSASDAEKGVYTCRESIEVYMGSHDGGICTGEAYKQVVKLTFFHGASLKDPAQLFNSSLGGNTRRAIDIREDDAIDEPAFKELIRAAVAFNAAKRKK